MIIYNTTFHVSNAITNEFIDWLKMRYLPQATAEGLTHSPQLTRIMGNHEDGTSYALQLQANSLSELQRWHRTTGKNIMSELTSHFGNAVVGFTTMMEKLELQPNSLNPLL